MSKSNQLSLPMNAVNQEWQKRPDNEILEIVSFLQAMHQKGRLGGLVMPEDSHPPIDKTSADNYHYFSLCMALNFRRNSYSLWRSAQRTFEDDETRIVFSPREVIDLSDSILKSYLGKHKLAIQLQKHSTTWKVLCHSIVDLLNGDIRNLFLITEARVPLILNYVQTLHRDHFPYLRGEKICNYWLSVIERYTDAKLIDRSAISVAPDTHVIQASVKIGLIAPHLRDNPSLPRMVAEEWKRILAPTGIPPIDIHTPLWLWSRGGFVANPPHLAKHPK